MPGFYGFLYIWNSTYHFTDVISVIICWRNLLYAQHTTQNTQGYALQPSMSLSQSHIYTVSLLKFIKTFGLTFIRYSARSNEAENGARMDKQGDADFAFDVDLLPDSSNSTNTGPSTKFV